MKTPLNLQLIREYGFEERTYKPDWDDTSIEFTLPNGFKLSTMTQCNNHSVNGSYLEGVDGYICLETKEELDIFISKSCETILQEIKDKYPKFDVDEWL